EHFRKLTNPLGFNAGRSDMADVRSDVIRDLAIRFSPEFRNRIDDVVLFAPLTKADVRRIARTYLARVERTVTAAGKTIEIDDAALELIASDGYSLSFGARFLKRLIDERVKLPITMRWKDGSHFHVRAAGHTITIDVSDSADDSDRALLRNVA